MARQASSLLVALLACSCETPARDAPAADAGPRADVHVERVCGDSFCDTDVGESATSCPSDCGERCGDGICGFTESLARCPEDCPTVCGDGTCSPGEREAECRVDCPIECGDGICEAGEEDCLHDCPGCRRLVGAGRAIVAVTPTVRGPSLQPWPAGWPVMAWADHAGADVRNGQRIQVGTTSRAGVTVLTAIDTGDGASPPVGYDDLWWTEGDGGLFTSHLGGPATRRADDARGPPAFAEADTDDLSSTVTYVAYATATEVVGLWEPPAHIPARASIPPVFSTSPPNAVFLLYSDMNADGRSARLLGSRIVRRTPLDPVWVSAPFEIGTIDPTTRPAGVSTMYSEWFDDCVWVDPDGVLHMRHDGLEHAIAEGARGTPAVTVTAYGGVIVFERRDADLWVVFWDADGNFGVPEPVVVAPGVQRSPALFQVSTSINVMFVDEAADPPAISYITVAECR